jgi:UDP-N-acetylenolpyruvoylglucosamine reductase
LAIIEKRGPLVLQTLYASVQGNARAKKWEWVGRGVRERVYGTFGIALEM